MVVEQTGHEFKATIPTFSNKVQRRQVSKQVPGTLQQKPLMTNSAKDTEWQSSSTGRCIVHAHMAVYLLQHRFVLTTRSHG